MNNQEVNSLLLLNKEEFEEKLKNYTYNDILNLCNSLKINTLVEKNKLASIHLSYKDCIDSLNTFKDFFDEGQNESNDEDENYPQLNIENFNAFELNEIIETDNSNLNIKINLLSLDNCKYFASGNINELGNWDINRAVELIENEDLLTCHINVDNYNDVEYKLFKVEGNGNIVWENGENRIITKEINYITWR